MKLSIVATLYRSAPYLDEFHQRASTAAADIDPDYEILLVDDGSPDESANLAKALVRRDPRVRLVELSRNFGHHKAILTGLRLARGDLVFLIDSDLEEPPELLADFAQELAATGADVVYGVQRTRKGGWFERASGALFYRAFRWLGQCQVPANLVTARLMKRDYVRALVRHRDREVFLAGLWVITGFHQVPLEVNKASKGTTTYTLARKLSVLVNAITSFSNRPLAAIFHLGCLVLAVSTTAAACLLIRRLFFDTMLDGWPSLILSVWFLGGLTLFCQGIIAIYLAKVFSEVKRRPYTIIRALHGFAGDAPHARRRRHRSANRTILHGPAPRVRPDPPGSRLEGPRRPDSAVRPAPEAARTEP